MAAEIDDRQPLLRKSLVRESFLAPTPSGILSRAGVGWALPTRHSRGCSRSRWAMPTLLICLAVPACRDSSADRPARPLAVIVSGDTRGSVIAGGCGCGPNQSGGLLRRGSYVEEVRRSADVVVADVGGAPAGTNEYQQAKFEAILRGELAMGLAAHNLGGPEAELGAEYLRSTRQKLHVPFISANLADAGGRLVADPAVIVTAGGKRIMFVAVVSPRFAIEGLH